MSRHSAPENGYIGNTPKGQNYETMIIDNRAYRIHNVTVHKFTMGDVDDPDLYAAMPLHEWQNSESGKWIMSHAIESPQWHRRIDHSSYGYQYAVTAKLKDVDYTFWTLKWHDVVDNKA
jgi:hypothetical protein